MSCWDLSAAPTGHVPPCRYRCETWAGSKGGTAAPDRWSWETLQMSTAAGGMQRFRELRELKLQGVLMGSFEATTGRKTPCVHFLEVPESSPSSSLARSHWAPEVSPLSTARSVRPAPLEGGLVIPVG